MDMVMSEIKFIILLLLLYYYYITIIVPLSGPVAFYIRTWSCLK